jgi:hypothetical protein
LAETIDFTRVLANMLCGCKKIFLNLFGSIKKILSSLQCKTNNKHNKTCHALNYILHQKIVLVPLKGTTIIAGHVMLMNNYKLIQYNLSPALKAGLFVR